jgi:hypothetical protein
VAVLLALLAFGCSGGPPAQTNPASANSAPLTSGPSVAAARTAGSRVIVVVEENHSIGQLIGSPQAPFLNRLAAKGTLLTSYFAITHPSLPNYLAMVSGDTQGITSDCGGCNLDAPNLVDQLESAGVSWKAYMEDLPAPCSDAHRAGAYAKKHDPFMYFASVRDHPDRCAKVVPLDQLEADLQAERLPRFVFVTPNQDHDMHGAGESGNDSVLIGTADRWLESLYGKLTGSSAWREDTRLVITWDEGARPSGPTGCCGGLAAGGNVATIITGPHVQAGRDDATYTHYSLLRSIEARFHLPYLDHAGDRSTIAIPALAGSSRP